MTRPATGDTADTEVVDPVCGEVFSPRLATFSSRHEGRTVWFCSATCKHDFDEDPDAFPPLDPEDLA